MSEANDNLQNADGNTENQENLNKIGTEKEVNPETMGVIHDENPPSDDEAVENNNDLIADDNSEETIEPVDRLFAEEGKENDDVPEDLIAEIPDEEGQEPVEGNPEPPQDSADVSPEIAEEVREENDSAGDPAETIQQITIPDEDLNDESRLKVDAQQQAIIDIEKSNAEESEDESLKERHEIPLKDYDEMTMDALVVELEQLVQNEKISSVREHIEEIRRAFQSKYQHFIEDKKHEFEEANPDSSEEFHYDLPLKARFDQLMNLYRDKKASHFKSLQNNLKANLEERLAIVDELKELINPQENIKDTLKHFNELRERWKNAGPIPKDKYNHVWNNYHFHVENFYDYLHLDREARDLDFKHNLEQKHKIIARVEELLTASDVNKAFRELQDLHRIWKEEIGPVSKDHREVIWNRFSELTRQMHEKREALLEKLRGSELENLERKKEIIAQLEALAQEKVGSHTAWLGQIEKVEALRNQFFSAGKVPSEANEDTWSAFKTAVRNFNSLKNSFYKDIKKDQNENLSKKQTLVAKAKELQESTDFAATTPVMKQIQEEWKQVGHVPRKYSDKLWKEFKAACNHYFEKMKEHRNEENAEEVEAFDKKKEFLDNLKEFQLTGDHKTDLDAIKAHIEKWKSFGRVPNSRRHIEGKFNKILDALFEKLSLSKKESEMMRFSNRMESLSESNDTRKLDNEKIFLMRKIDEVQSEIFQLENNIQFFANAKKDNPMVLEVRKNIDRHKEELSTLKAKLKQLRSMKQE